MEDKTGNRPRKKKILVNTNHTKWLTGFGKNAKNLLKYLYADGRFEIIEYCAAMQWSASELSLQPWIARGTLPDSQQEIQELNRDPGRARNASYGEYNIERAISEFKPDVAMFIEDSWGVTFNTNKSFWGKIPSVFWVTQDSLPLINVEDAKKTPYYWCWSGFATNELHRLGYTSAITQYPLVDLNGFNILTDDKKREIRKRFNIPEQTFIIGQVFRNQLRKLAPNQVEGYSLFKKHNPGISSLLLLVTNFAEGWDIPKLAEQYGVPKNEIWCAYVSHETGDYLLAPFQGNDVNCPFSGKEKAMHTVNVIKGVTEEALNEIYNIMDVLSHPATSGACELPLVEAAAAGKVILTADYSYGEDVIKLNEAAFPMEWAKSTEIGTQFIKSSPYPYSIAKLLKKVFEMSRKKREELGLLSRKWAKTYYDAEVNGKKITDFLIGLPDVDWNQIKLTKEPKNDTYVPSNNENDSEWLKELYLNILNMKVEDTDVGLLYWLDLLSKAK